MRRQLVFGAYGMHGPQSGVMEKCGNLGSDIQSRVLRGEDFKRGDFPWMVALIKKVTKKAPIFFCAGTLVSSRHVVTGNERSQILRVRDKNFKSFICVLVAAHCIKSKFKNSELRARDLNALFGVHNRSDLLEAGRVALSPKEIEVHPAWESNDERYDADIAIMTFRSGAIPSSMFIQPICLWNDDAPPSQTKGYVAGWGLNQKSPNSYEETPTNLKVQIHTDAHCWYTEPKLFELSSSRTFCAGKADGIGICEINSGGGLSIKVGLTFYFRGIVSSILLDEVSCDASKFSYFTDVVKFKPWIDQIMSEDGEALIQTVVEANLRCTTELYSWMDSLGCKDLQTCYIKDQKIDEEGFSVADASNLSIQALSIEDNEEVKFLPENIAESFTGLIVYRVLRCSIRTVNGKHFKGLNNLKSLELQGNVIEDIDGDSFKDLTRLGYLALNYNQIKMTDPNWFQSLDTLWQLWIGYNQIEFLDEQIFDILRNIREISLDNNKIATVPSNLFKDNLKLEEIKLGGNKIQTICSTMFDHLKDLTYVDLRSNVCVNDFFFHKRFNGMKNVLRINCESLYQEPNKVDYDD